jgi:hypothetical protein
LLDEALHALGGEVIVLSWVVVRCQRTHVRINQYQPRIGLAQSPVGRAFVEYLGLGPVS